MQAQYYCNEMKCHVLLPYRAMQCNTIKFNASAIHAYKTMHTRGTVYQFIKQPRLKKHCDWSNRVHYNSTMHAAYVTRVHYVSTLARNLRQQ